MSGNLLDFNLALLVNAFLLLGLVMALDLAMGYRHDDWLSRPRILAGLFAGLIAVVLIRVSATLQEGIIFDTRSILLAVSGLYLGFVPTAIATAITAAYRWSLGGVAALTGVAVIFASGALGLLWRHYLRERLDNPGWRPLLALGIAVHVTMLLLMLLMPWDRARMVLAVISLPVLLIYPPITVALGLFFAGRLRQQRALAALVDSERRFREIFDNVDEAIFIHDAETGRILDVNRRMSEMYRCSREQAVGLLPSEISATEPPYTAAEARQWLARARDEGPQTFLWRARRFDGTLFWAEVVLRMTTIAGERRILAMVRNIDERLAAEAALRESERARQEEQRVALQEQRDARLAALNLMEDAVAARKETEKALAELRKLALAIEQSAESIIITDTDARIEYVNDSFERITGYRRDEVIGRNPRLLNSGKTPAATFAAMWQTITRGETWKGEFINRRKDGSEYVEFAIVTPLRQPDGTIMHYVAVKEDITEKRRIGEELDAYRHHLEALVEHRTVEVEEARRRAEAANQAKSAFLANMSHEIRTPLNAIIGLTHLLQRQTESPEQRARLDKIIQAAHHLLSLTNDILDLAKIEAGRMTLTTAPFDAARLVEEVAALMIDEAHRRGLELIVDIDPTLAAAPPLLGDAMRLRQALLNYVGNAIKFTERGTVTLRARVLAASDDTLQVRFEVEDTGIGIAPSDLSRLFKSFEQLDPSVARRFGGTGLGLAITRLLAQLMGGEVGVDSTSGAGSRFWIDLPLRREGHNGAASWPAPATHADAEARLRHVVASRGGARVLVAEDNPINQEVAHDLLAAVGITVDLANDGEKALALAAAADYDAILMDVNMPTLDGIEATRRIRALPGRAHTPILALTAGALPEERRRCLATGMNDFVAKPVDPQDLYAALLRHLPAAADLPPPTVAAPTTDQNAEWRARLAQLPGFDLDTGLKHTGRDVMRHAELLRRFIDAHAEDGQRIRERLAAGDRDGARRIAHTCKGVAATLGLAAIASAALALEGELRAEGAMPDPRLQAFESELSAFIAAFAACPPAAAAAPENADPEVLAAALTRLETLLARDDPEANRVFATIAVALRRPAGADFAPLERAIAAYAYPEALARLRSLRARLSHDDG